MKNYFALDPQVFSYKLEKIHLKMRIICKFIFVSIISTLYCASITYKITIKYQELTKKQK